jgi:hypothetical protein
MTTNKQLDPTFEVFLLLDAYSLIWSPVPIISRRRRCHQNNKEIDLANIDSKAIIYCSFFLDPLEIVIDFDFDCDCDFVINLVRAKMNVISGKWSLNVKDHIDIHWKLTDCWISSNKSNQSSIIDWLTIDPGDDAASDRNPTRELRMGQIQSIFDRVKMRYFVIPGLLLHFKLGSQSSRCLR